MEQLVEFFLQGKSPMIEPFVPNSLYYRKKSARRAEMIEHMKARKLGLQPGSVKRTLYDMPRRRVARSMKQLQKANAESELLGPYRSLTYSSSLIQRPQTSPAVVQTARNNAKNNRPHTAIATTSKVFLTEFDPPDEQGGAKGDNSDMFEQMGMLQREKYENRSKIVCSATARADLDLRSMSGLNAFSMQFDDDYFDWETSETHLQTLEDKIKNFCQTIEPNGYRETVPRVSSLRRFCIGEDRDVSFTPCYCSVSRQIRSNR